MKKVALAAILALSPLAAIAAEPAPVPARKACEELKGEIAAKLDAKEVQNYALKLVKTAEVKADDKVVGSCDVGAMKIVYVRK